MANIHRSFRPLIRLSEQRLDEKKRKQAELERQRDGVLGEISALDAQVEYERDVASKLPPGMAYTFTHFVAHAKKRRAGMEERVAKLNRQIELARIEVQGAYMELRKYEKAEENRLEKVKEEQSKREDLEMDEIAMNLYRYNQQKKKDFGEDGSDEAVVIG